MNEFVSANSNLNIVESALPSYLSNFLPDIQKIILVHKKASSTPEDNKSSVKIERDDDYSDENVSECELTGNPLKVDLNGDENVSLSLIEKSKDQVNYWTIEESKHLPVSLMVARNFINSQNKTKKESAENTPLTCVVCDGSDPLHTVILAAKMTKTCLTTAVVYVLGCFYMDHGLMTLDNMRKDHIKNLKGENAEIDSAVRMKYVIYGTDLLHKMPSRTMDNYGSVAVSVVTNKQTFKAPLNNFDLRMTIQIVAGHKCSSVLYLWEELCLLQTLLNILANNEMSNDESTHFCENPLDEHDICDGISKSLSSNFLLKREEQKKLNFECLREDTFLDNLWKLLKCSENLLVLRDSFHYLFEELADSNSNLIIKAGPSIISKIIDGIIHNKLIISTITLRQALEFLFELGAEKLKNDYETIIKQFCPVSTQDIDKKWNAFQATVSQSLGNPRKTRITQNLKSMGGNVIQNTEKLTYLGKLHIVTEMILLVKEQINLSDSSFDHFCECVFKRYLKDDFKLEDFSELYNIPLCEFSCQLHSCDVNIIESFYPVRWTMQMTSKANSLQVTTVYDLSQKKVFPSTIYDNYEDPTETEEKIIYYVAKMVRYKDFLDI